MADDKKLGEIWAISAGPNVEVRAFAVGLTQFRHTVGSEVKQLIPEGLDPQNVSVQNRDLVETIEIGTSRGLTYGQGYPIPPFSEWSPLGGVRPLSFTVNVAPSSLFSAYAQLRARSDALGDTTFAVNSALTQQVSIFRDLTINAGVIVTAGFRLQIVVCRNLIFGSAASRLTARGLGYAGAITEATAGATFDGQFPAAADLANTLFALGGVVAGAAAAGGPGGASRPVRLLSYLALLSGAFYPYGAIVGGGAGAGRSAAASGGAGGAGLAGGGAGGGGNGGPAGGWGRGGNGGGALIVICDDVQNAAGIIDADGEDGTAPSQGNCSGGGGGGGGFCLLFNKGALTIVPIVRANGGAAPAGPGFAGGVGGLGLSGQVPLT